MFLSLKVLATKDIQSVVVYEGDVASFLAHVTVEDVEDEKVRAVMDPMSVRTTLMPFTVVFLR